MKREFYDFSEKSLQQGSICKLSRASLLGQRKHCRECEKMHDEKKIDERVSKLGKYRFVVLSQSCDIKNKTGFRALKHLYCLFLFNIDQHCLDSIETFGKKIGEDLKKHLVKVKNTEKRNLIQKSIDRMELKQAFDQLSLVMGKRHESLKDKIKMYDTEKKMFGEMKEKKHNSNYQDCFFFPKEEKLGIKQDSIVRFSTPEMIAPEELEVLGKLNHPYSEALAQRFGTYFFRVALPD